MEDSTESADFVDRVHAHLCLGSMLETTLPAYPGRVRDELGRMTPRLSDIGACVPGVSWAWFSRGFSKDASSLTCKAA